ncbi:MAG: efflux RND transporter permease subunit, partial [Acidobacteriota bacterium]
MTQDPQGRWSTGAGAPPRGGPGPDPDQDARHTWEQALPRFSLSRRVTVLVLLATSIVVGVVAVQLIPLELLPTGWENPHLAVNVPWRDAPSQEVVDKLILPLEEELATVRGLDRVSSYARTGWGGVFLLFKQGTDMDVAYREVRDRTQRARLRMPDDVEQVFIRKEDPSGFPIFIVGLAVDPGLSDVYTLVDHQIKRRLERLDGVAAVEVQGLDEKEVLIELDREATEAAGLSIYRLGQELSGDNFTLASGHVLSGGKKLLLRSVARYGSLRELEERPVAPGVRLADVATVSYAVPERRTVIRANGKPAYALFVLKEGQANTIEVTDRVRAEIGRMQADPRLAGLEVKMFFDQGRAIRESLDTLLDSGRIGALFAVGVLFFFLRRLRLTLIITLAIPLSILIALAVMYFAGETLNIFTLLGLMISVGLLVDNSVVVAENVFRLHQEGVPRREACVRGAGEMALAITMATLTTVAVFLPVSLVEGGGRFFLQRLSIPISVSLLASLGVALVIIPLAVYVTLPNGRRRQRSRGSSTDVAPASGVGEELASSRGSTTDAAPAAGVGEELASSRGSTTDAASAGGVGEELASSRGSTTDALRRAYEATFGRLNRLYGRLLGVALTRRLDVVMVLIALFATVIVLFQTGAVRLVPMQEDEAPAFELDVDLPRNTTFEETQAYFREAERVLEDLQEELGLDGYLTVASKRGGGEIQGWFESPRTTNVTPRQAAERVRDALPERGGVTFYLGSESRTGEDDEASTHAFTLVGDDPLRLEEVALGLEELFREVPGVLGVKRSEEATPSELALTIDRERAQRLGVSPEVLAAVVGYALRGETLPRFQRDGREVPVRVRFREEDRRGLSQLRTFAVPTAGGGLVPLGSLTRVEETEAPRSIQRRDRRISRTVTLELEEGREEAARERLQALAGGVDLPEGISFRAGARPPGMDEDVLGLLFAALLSVVFIYLLMGFLFESFILPLSILGTIPLAAVGVAWIHWAASKSLDVLGVVGGVLLIGVVVNNGIVLVDSVNRLRGEGIGRREAILLASERRFRPIMMTALTTICGMIPLTLGGASSLGLSYTSFGLTLIGGMASATFLTLLVVPIFYT